MTPRMMLRSSLSLISFLTIFSTGLCIEPGTTKCRDEWHAAKNDPNTQIGKQWKAMQADEDVGLRRWSGLLHGKVSLFKELALKEKVTEKNWGIESEVFDKLISKDLIGQMQMPYAPQYEKGVIYNASATEMPTLRKIVDKASDTLKIAPPLLVIYDNPAFPWCGMIGESDLESSAILITTCMLETLNDEELFGILSHECAHLSSTDTFVRMMLGRASVPLALLTIFVAWYITHRKLEYGALVTTGVCTVSLVAMLALFNRLIVPNIFRGQEWRADRVTAEKVEGAGQALIKALTTLKEVTQQGLSERLDKVSQERNRVKNDKEIPDFALKRFMAYFDEKESELKNGPHDLNGGPTHPALGDRIAALEKIVANQSEQAAA